MIQALRQTNEWRLVMRQLGGIRAPTLLIWGERDYMVPLHYGRTMARLLPHARLAVGRGLSHVPFFERPAAFHRLVAEFLQAN
jgi:pimeloyl-ACP methyl ester carboxylesterase